MSESRSEFEAWAKPRIFILDRRRDDSYEQIPTEAAWEAWQASRRAALEAAISTPDGFEAWWAHEREQNSGNEIGADYRHWALLGYRAALESAAKLAESKANDWHGHDGKYACEDCANTLRALSKAQEGQ